MTTVGKLGRATDVVSLDADVVEAVIGEAPAAMAFGACRFGAEQEEAPLACFGDRLLVARNPSIEGCGS